MGVNGDDVESSNKDGSVGWDVSALGAGDPGGVEWRVGVRDR